MEKKTTANKNTAKNKITVGSKESTITKRKTLKEAKEANKEVISSAEALKRKISYDTKVVTPKTTSRRKIVTAPTNSFRLDPNKTIDCLVTDVCVTSPIVSTDHKVNKDKSITVVYTKSIIGTDSKDFINDIAFALHNRFNEYDTNIIVPMITVKDISNTKFEITV